MRHRPAEGRSIYYLLGQKGAHASRAEWTQQWQSLPAATPNCTPLDSVGGWCPWRQRTQIGYSPCRSHMWSASRWSCHCPDSAQQTSSRWTLALLLHLLTVLLMCIVGRSENVEKEEKKNMLRQVSYMYNSNRKHILFVQFCSCTRILGFWFLGLSKNRLKIKNLQLWNDKERITYLFYDFGQTLFSPFFPFWSTTLLKVIQTIP